MIICETGVYYLNIMLESTCFCLISSLEIRSCEWEYLLARSKSKKTIDILEKLRLAIPLQNPGQATHRPSRFT